MNIVEASVAIRQKGKLARLRLVMTDVDRAGTETGLILCLDETHFVKRRSRQSRREGETGASGRSTRKGSQRKGSQWMAGGVVKVVQPLESRDEAKKVGGERERVDRGVGVPCTGRMYAP